MTLPPLSHSETFDKSTVIDSAPDTNAAGHSNHKKRYQKYLKVWVTLAKNVTGSFSTLVVRHTDCVCGCSV
jgi:hypothetical protein